jgi:hypothetical protein
MKRFDSFLTSSKHPYGTIYDFLDRVDFVVEEMKTIQISKKDYACLKNACESDEKDFLELQDAVCNVYEDWFDALLPISELLNDIWMIGERYKHEAGWQEKATLTKRRSLMQSKLAHLMDMGTETEHEKSRRNFGKKRFPQGRINNGK